MGSRSGSRYARSTSRAARSYGASSGAGPTDPSTVPGKQTWARGKDLGALNSAVTTWGDQGGAGVVITATAPVVVTDATPRAVFTGTASTENSAGNNAAKAFDGNTGTAWITSSGNTTGWLRAEMPTAVIATAYGLTSIDASRMANTWTFEGSNNGSSWTTLDTRTGETSWGATTRFYQFTNTTAYLYYRLNVTANNGDVSFLSVAEMSVHVQVNNKAALFNGGRLDTTGLSTTGTTRELWMVADSIRAPNSLLSLGNGGASTYYPFTDGKIYDDTFISTRQSFTPTMSIIGVQRLLRITMTGGVWTYYLDNVQQATASGQTFNLGLKRPVSSLVGTVHEFLILDAISDSTQVAGLIAYFNSEHGLTVT